MKHELIRLSNMNMFSNVILRFLVLTIVFLVFVLNSLYTSTLVSLSIDFEL